MFEDAIALAVQAHRGQTDKADEPYILHVMRVVLGVDGDVERPVAALHDTVEDCGFELDDIRSQVGDEVAEAVDGMTRRDGEEYADFIERCSENSIARAVKLSDLRDNMNVARLPVITEEDVRRLQKYESAKSRLLS